jgi:hypothetical protein
MYTEFWWGNLKERDHLEFLDVVESIILKPILKYRINVWTGLIQLRTGTSGGLF